MSQFFEVTLIDQFIYVKNGPESVIRNLSK